jgi:hypothetical protein
MERWKDIPNYKGIYQASNTGFIRTHKDKTTFTKNGNIRKWSQRTLRPKGITPKTGFRVSLWKDKISKDFLVARLVATTFLENLINTKMTVNHKDGNRLNNNINNLEWMTLGDNIRHGFETGLYTCQKRTRLTNLDTKETVVFRSMSLASQYLENNNGYISCQIKRGKFKNEVWKWEVLV